MSHTTQALFAVLLLATLGSACAGTQQPASMSAHAATQCEAVYFERVTSPDFCIRCCGAIHPRDARARTSCLHNFCDSR